MLGSWSWHDLASQTNVLAKWPRALHTMPHTQIEPTSPNAAGSFHRCSCLGAVASSRAPSAMKSSSCRVLLAPLHCRAVSLLVGCFAACHCGLEVALWQLLLSAALPVWACKHCSSCKATCLCMLRANIFCTFVVVSLQRVVMTRRYNMI